MNDLDLVPFDKEEEILFKSIENDEWVSINDNDELLNESIQTAELALKKNKRMNIRIAERDLKNLKIKALQEGLPYQTMVSMILHKYITGQLSETKKASI